MGKTDGYTKSGTEHRSDASQEMYKKENHYEGNMGHTVGNKGYEPSHIIDKDTGDIQGAGITGGKC